MRSVLIAVAALPLAFILTLVSLPWVLLDIGAACAGRPSEYVRDSPLWWWLDVVGPR